MTGIEKIIAQIEAENAAEVEKVLADANARLAREQAEAEKRAEALAAAARESADARVKEAIAAGESAAALAKRKALLVTRQELINDVIAEAKDKLLNLPDDKMTELLLKMAARYAGSATGEMRLCEKDLARLPADFAEKLTQAAPDAKLTVGKAPAAISGGFVLLCGEVEQNCSFESLFAAAKDEMQDIAQKELFCS